MTKLETIRKPWIITVGDELIMGERRNGNQEWLLQFFTSRSYTAAGASILPDNVDTIAGRVADLKQHGHFPVVVSGGLGGTHDDLTREGIARGLDLRLATHPECFDVLNSKYGENFTAQRQRMSLLPEGCRLIMNPIGAPGFEIKGVYAFPGFPNMMQPMVESVADELAPRGGEALSALDVTLAAAEGDVAMDIEHFAASHPLIKVGLYPSTTRMAKEVTIRLRYPASDCAVPAAFRALIAGLAKRLNLEPGWGDQGNGQR